MGDMVVRYVIDRESGRVGLVLFPQALQASLASKRQTLNGEPFIDSLPGELTVAATAIDPLVHLKLVGDAYPTAFGQGRTMRASASNDRFVYRHQEVVQEQAGPIIVTTLQSEDGLVLEHRLRAVPETSVVVINATFRNQSSAAVTLEALTSFSLGGITPFDPADGVGRLAVHRYRSCWSAEGRLETRSVEDLHLERSWSGAGVFAERFGQVGSMPVRGFFPFVAATDTQADVTWGAQLAWAGSWQMEAFRQHDDLCLSGGLADREFGHWMKTVLPGQSFCTPTAAVACVQGGLDDLTDRLTRAQTAAADTHPPVERSLPVIFNEWCTTWGSPDHERMLAIADRVADLGVRYLVIDAGWYRPREGNWSTAHGDWLPSDELFPQGLRATADAIRQRGLIPGIWFEFETVGASSTMWDRTDLLLQRDGVPITANNRRFWDLNHPEVVDYLSQRVIELIRRCGFGYLKVDYNETIGLGTDGAESQGEGLRRHIEAVYRFFDRIREELPELVIENCSSGGHRLEPSMLGRTAMSSFSDAHELVEIPIIAANVQSLLLPRQSQVWAVVHPQDSDRRLAYVLAGTFLGRMCLSGDVVGLGDAQFALVRQAVEMYKQSQDVVRAGVSRRFGEQGKSWRRPEGWQAVVRTSDDHQRLLVVAHTFGSAPATVPIPLPAGDWAVADQFPRAAELKLGAGEATWATGGDFSAVVLLLTRR